MISLATVAVAAERRYLIALGAVLVVTVASCAALVGWLGYRALVDQRSADLLSATERRAQMLAAAAITTPGSRIEDAAAVHLVAALAASPDGHKSGEIFLLRVGGAKPKTLFEQRNGPANPLADRAFRDAIARARGGRSTVRVVRSATANDTLIASTPIADSGLVLVERVDLAESTGPMARAALASAVAAALIVIAALVAFRAVGGRILDSARSRARAFADVLDHLQDGVLIRDRSGRIRLANQALCSNLGYSREELRRLSVSDLIPGRSEEQLRELHRRVHRGELPRHEVEHRRRDGSTFPVEVQLSPLNLGGEELLIVVARDVSAQHLMLRRLEASERRFRTLFETCADAMFLFEPRGGRVRAANPSACALLDYQQHELLAMRIGELVADPDPDGLHAEWAQVAAGESVWRVDRMRCRDGREVVTESRLSPVELDGETLILAVDRDVTERERNRAALERLNAELEQRITDRTLALERVNRELEAFNSAVAHDLRAPLRALAAANARLEQDPAVAREESLGGCVAQIRECRIRLERLVDGMLALTRAGHGEIERRPVDLAALARAEVEELRARDPERAVEVSLPEKLTVDADPRLMRSVLHNLLDNAWKFTRDRNPAHIELTAERRGRTVSCTLSDDGVGFDPRYAASLFEPLRRLHPDGRFEGEGIGLSTVQRIVHRHGGRVWAESRPEHGARFHFELPDAEGAG